MTPEQQQRDMTFVRQMQKYHRTVMAHQTRSGGQTSTSAQPLSEGFNPASIGARRARDGHHYLADPTRPGKYLRVIFQ
jgi:hypothetical protein